jgi:hypothetical protein
MNFVKNGFEWINLDYVCTVKTSDRDNTLVLVLVNGNEIKVDDKKSCELLEKILEYNYKKLTNDIHYIK